MKILLLAPHPFFQERGTPIAERMLVDVLGRHGHEIDLLTIPGGTTPHLPNTRVVRTPRIPWGGGVRPGFSLKKLAYDVLLLAMFFIRVRRERYDVVHAVEESAFMALAAKVLLGIPYVYDMDSSLPEQMVDRFPLLRAVRPLLDGIEGIAVRGSLAVLVVCRALEEKVRRYAPTKPVARIEDVTLLSSGDEGDELVARGVGSDGPIVMYVGNLAAYQGLDLLTEAFSPVLDAVPDAHLVVIGGGAHALDRYRSLVERRGLADRVHFLGPRPLRLLGWYLGQANVVVSPRIRGRNTPLKLYSYLDSGRPLAATRIPAHTQVLDDTIAYLAEPRAAALGAGIVRLLTDDALAERLARAARERVRREFSPHAFEAKVLRFYRMVDDACAVRRAVPSPEHPSWPPKREREGKGVEPGRISATPRRRGIALDSRRRLSTMSSVVEPRAR